MLEIELKLKIAKEDNFRLYSHPLLAHLSTKEEKLVSTYFDSAEYDLKKNGYALRIRVCEKGLLQTLKSVGEVKGDLHHREEWEHLVNNAYPDLSLFEDKPLRHKLESILHKKKLKPLFKTEFLRTSWQLELSDKTHIEVAFDQGEITADGKKETINEIELELKEGNSSKLNNIAGALKSAIPLTVEYRNKAERGYLLVDSLQSPKKIIIEGVTEEGQQFRPSDWAERMSGSLCTFGRNHRVVYSPLLQPMVRGGNKCVVLDPSLQDTNPSLFESIMDFAKENKLKVENVEDKK